MRSERLVAGGVLIARLRGRFYRENTHHLWETS
jgi:hypothetical protein